MGKYGGAQAKKKIEKEKLKIFCLKGCKAKRLHNKPRSRKDTSAGEKKKAEQKNTVSWGAVRRRKCYAPLWVVVRVL